MVIQHLHHHPRHLDHGRQWRAMTFGIPLIPRPQMPMTSRVRTMAWGMSHGTSNRITTSIGRMTITSITISKCRRRMRTNGMPKVNAIHHHYHFDGNFANVRRCRSFHSMHLNFVYSIWIMKSTWCTTQQWRRGKFSASWILIGYLVLW